MGAWSPEHIGGAWQGGSSGKVGDRSSGHTLDARARYTEGMLTTTLATIKATAEGWHAASPHTQAPPVCTMAP